VERGQREPSSQDEASAIGDAVDAVGTGSGIDIGGTGTGIVSRQVAGPGKEGAPRDKVEVEETTAEGNPKHRAPPPKSAGDRA